MTYRTGTVANTLPAANLVIAVMEPDMINVGWVKVSTNVVANQYIWNVYKSPGANNNVHSDFYIAMGWDNASNANLLMTLFEGWNTGTNTATNYCPNTAPTPLANGAANANPTALPNVTGSNAMYLATSAGPGVPQNTALSTSSFTYYQSITIDRVIIVTSNTTSNVNSGASFYGGMYDSWIANTIDTMPIMLCNLQGTQGAIPPIAANSSLLSCIFTREPVQSASNTANFWGALCQPFNTNFNSVTAEAYTNRYLVTRGIIYGRNGSTSAGNAIRGLPKDIWYCTIGPPSVGDLISFIEAGVTYTGFAAKGTGQAALVSNFYPYVLQV